MMEGSSAPDGPGDPTVDPDPGAGRGWSRTVVAGLIDDASQTTASVGDVAAAARLAGLAERLRADRLQFAVVGQFKRGKSTLLNALIGAPLLPVAAIPATAVTTFIADGPEPAARLTFGSGSVQDETFATVEELATRLVAVVTEEANPHNVLDVVRVNVFLPARRLGDGVVLVDTPGIGSTHLHNSATARAALSECDAALLVFSADLPITEAEEAYVREIGQLVGTLVVVMNKADLASDGDRAALERLLRTRLQAALGRAEVPIWPVSAKRALAAVASGDATALSRSGLPALKAHLTGTLARNRHALLVAAIADKSARAVAQARSRVDLRVAALRLPLNDLERKIAAFEDLASAFEAEAVVAQDLLVGDTTRARKRLEADCVDLDRSAQMSLRQELDERLRRAETAEAARAEVTAAIAAFFERGKADMLARVQSDLAMRVGSHCDRLQTLADRFGASTADLMGVETFTIDVNADLPQIREPYWVGSGLADSLGSLTLGALAALLPRAVRDARERRRLRRGIAGALVRNLSSLQWALQQAIDDAFRTIGPHLAAEIQQAVRQLRTTLAEAHTASLDEVGSSRVAAEPLTAASSRLGSIERRLRAPSHLSERVDCFARDR